MNECMNARDGLVIKPEASYELNMALELWNTWDNCLGLTTEAAGDAKLFPKIGWQAWDSEQEQGEIFA